MPRLKSWAMQRRHDFKCCRIPQVVDMTTLMSKRPRRIERAIEAAFKSNPDGYFSVHDLARIAYPGEVYGHIERSKRVAILRAAPKVAKSLHWVAFRSTAIRRGAEVI